MCVIYGAFGPICVSRWQTELDAIIGEHRMDFVGNGFDQGDQEGRCGNTIGFFGKLDEGELRSSVDRHEEVELSLGGLHFGDVDVEEADRIRLELFSLPACRFRSEQDGRSHAVADNDAMTSASDAGLSAGVRTSSHRAAEAYAGGSQR